MKQEFYYLDGNEQKGPFSINELKSVGLNPYTKVWKSGTKLEWTHAIDVSELQFLFASEPKTKQIYQSEKNQSNVVGKAGFILALTVIGLGWIPVVGWIIWVVAISLSITGMLKKPKDFFTVAGFFISLLMFIIFAIMENNIYQMARKAIEFNWNTILW